MIQKLTDKDSVTGSRSVNDSRMSIEVDTPELIFQARWIEDVKGLQGGLEDWQRLTECALRPNFCFEPNFLIPAFEHLNEQGAKLLVVEAACLADSNQTVWCGIMPLVKTSVFKLPFAAMEIWKHDQCFDCTPILRSDCAAEALRYAFKFLKDQGVSLLSADTIANDDVFKAVWDQVVSDTRSATFVRQAFERACFRPAENHESYVKQHVSKSICKNTKRLGRRLAEQGELEFHVSDETSDFEQLADAFLEIEASGWKAESGTALMCKPSTEQFYRSMVEASAKRNRIRFLSVTLDREPIAMLSDLYSERHGFAYKTAFDESYSAYSPGLLAEVHNIEKMHDYQVDYVDSCTEPDNQTINRMWGQRLAFQKTIVALKGGPAQWAIKSLPTVKRWANHFRKNRG